MITLLVGTTVISMGLKQLSFLISYSILSSLLLICLSCSIISAVFSAFRRVFSMFSAVRESVCVLIPRLRTATINITAVKSAPHQDEIELSMAISSEFGWFVWCSWLWYICCTAPIHRIADDFFNTYPGVINKTHELLPLLRGFNEHTGIKQCKDLSYWHIYHLYKKQGNFTLPCLAITSAGNESLFSF